MFELSSIQRLELASQQSAAAAERIRQATPAYLSPESARGRQLLQAVKESLKQQPEQGDKDGDNN